MSSPKNIIAEYFKLIESGKFKEGLRFFAPDCKTHNPFVVGNMNALTDAMITAKQRVRSEISRGSVCGEVFACRWGLCCCLHSTYGFSKQTK